MRFKTRVFVVITLLRDDCLLCNSVSVGGTKCKANRAIELEIFSIERVLRVVLFVIVRDATCVFEICVCIFTEMYS